MSFCPKGLKVNNIVQNMSSDDLEYTLASCEMTCNRYYGCDTASFMQDKLKIFNGEMKED